MLALKYVYRFSLLVCLFAVCKFSISQSHVNDIGDGDSQFFIRNCFKSLSLGIDDEQISSSKYSMYGNLLSNNSAYIYGFSAHEFDKNLNLYYFPSRVFSPNSKRFFQPDPKNQYFSPYVYLKGNPVNYIDKDGKEGRPLFLHASQHEMPADAYINAEMSDLASAAPNAYSYSMQQFVDGEIGDIPEWDGNVFLMSHMVPETGVFNTESADEMGDLLSKNPLVRKAEGMGKAYSYVDPRNMGSMLQEFAEKRNVALRNVTIGGCGGSSAARKVGGGFLTKGGMAKHKVRFVGLKDKFRSRISGPISTERDKMTKPLDRPRYSYVEGRRKFSERYKYHDDGTRTFDRHVYQDDNGEWKDPTNVEGEDLREFVSSGRIPRGLEEDFEEHAFFY